MVELRVLRMGEGLGLMLTEEVAAQLGAKEGSAVQLEKSAQGGYRLVPADPAMDAMMAEIDDVIDRFPETLHILAR